MHPDGAKQKVEQLAADENGEYKTIENFDAAPNVRLNDAQRLAAAAAAAILIVFNPAAFSCRRRIVGNSRHQIARALASCRRKARSRASSIDEERERDRGKQASGRADERARASRPNLDEKKSARSILDLHFLPATTMATATAAPRRQKYCLDRLHAANSQKYETPNVK